MIPTGRYAPRMSETVLSHCTVQILYSVPVGLTPVLRYENWVFARSRLLSMAKVYQYEYRYVEGYAYDSYPYSYDVLYRY